MMLRLPRVVTAPLPEGQDWTIRKAGDKAVIVVNENLNGEEYQAAWRAAYASMRRRHLVWIPLPAAAIGTWLTRKLRTPGGAATLASLATAAAVYGVAQLDGADLPRTIAEPPVVVTVHHTPAATTLSPSPSLGRRTPTMPPSASPLPERTSHPPATSPTTTPVRTTQPTTSTRPPRTHPSRRRRQTPQRPNRHASSGPLRRARRHPAPPQQTRSSHLHPPQFRSQPSVTGSTCASPSIRSSTSTPACSAKL